MIKTIKGIAESLTRPEKLYKHCGKYYVNDTKVSDGLGYVYREIELDCFGFWCLGIDFIHPSYRLKLFKGDIDNE